MGLAPYGRPGACDFEIFTLRDDRVFVQYDWMKNFRDPARTDTERRDRFQEFADLAYLVQSEIERALLYIANARYEAWPAENLCYAGGVALNAVANRRLKLEGAYKNLYIHPAAGDNGLAVGCAYYGWLEVLKGDKVVAGSCMRLGKAYGRDVVEQAVDKAKGQLRSVQISNVPGRAAKYLADGKVIGWFQGRAEFGPRALGGRSILADPRSRGIKDYVNGSVKFREDFRPFAPSVLSNQVTKYFEENIESPHMLLVSRMRKECISEFKSVVHLNQTSRLQTVGPEGDPLFRALLEEFMVNWSGNGIEYISQ